MIKIFIGAGSWGLCIPRESKNHVNDGPVSIWDINEPVRTTSNQVVTILGANNQRASWQTSRLMEPCRML